jgi:hypothetical protein
MTYITGSHTKRDTVLCRKVFHTQCDTKFALLSAATTKENVESVIVCGVAFSSSSRAAEKCFRRRRRENGHRRDGNIGLRSTSCASSSSVF